MREHDHYEMATAAAEAMHALLELEYEQGERDPDAMMVRLKDLAAFSLTHADIMERREGVELLALARFFGMASDTRFQDNQERLGLLSEEVIEYEGQAEAIQQEIATREARGSQRGKDDAADPQQPRLL